MIIKIMKKMRRSFILAAACLLCLCACGPKRAKVAPIDLAVGSPDISLKTDYAVFGLLGDVKSVQYENGEELVFSDKGHARKPRIFQRSYDRNTRYDGRPDGVVKSVFDSLGRVIAQEEFRVKRAYTYKGNAYYPVSMTVSVLDSLNNTQESTVEFSYNKNDFDDHGNWTARKENGATVTRTIEYHPDPYALSIDKAYGCPKAVARAFYKGEVTGNADLALSTYPYNMRKVMRLSAEKRQEMWDTQDQEKTRIVKYRIKGTKKGKVEGTPVVYVRTKVTLANGKSHTETIRCHKEKDGCWYRDNYLLNE